MSHRERARGSASKTASRSENVPSLPGLSQILISIYMYIADRDIEHNFVCSWFGACFSIRSFSQNWRRNYSEKISVHGTVGTKKGILKGTAKKDKLEVFKTTDLQKFPIMWSGRLALKSMETSINLHYLTGRQQFLKDVLGSESFDEKPRRDSVRITQRLRLDNGQLQREF